MQFYDSEGLKWDEVYILVGVLNNDDGPDYEDAVYVTRNLDNANMIINTRWMSRYDDYFIVAVKMDDLLADGLINERKLTIRRQVRQQSNQRHRNEKRRSNQMQQSSGSSSSSSKRSRRSQIQMQED